MRLVPSPLLPVLFATLLAACTKPNPAVCCLDSADCSEVGIGEVRNCAAGLACVDHQCDVPSCASDGCAASAPVCNVRTDVCDPCTSLDDCSRFADTPVCETSSGGCVQCIAPSDCPTAQPICDANACRAPRVDADCPSGALGDDGACVDTADVVYLDPNGTNVGSCNKAVPCQTVAFAVSLTTGARNHIVFAPGAYTSADETYNSSDTSAPALYFHGHGAEVLGPFGGDGCLMGLSISATVRDLKVTVRSIGGTAICANSGPILIERVETTGGQGISVFGTATIRDFTGTRSGIYVSDGSLTLDRAVIDGASIFSAGPAVVQISNVLIYGTSSRPLSLASGASGTVTSTTIVTSGVGTGGASTGSRGLDCPSTVLVRSSIVWSPGSAAAPISGCNLVNVIAGPVAVAGAMNVDPLFVDALANNYHLAGGSPARDAVTSGPAVDFEGEARPQGAMFDIGADEAAP